MKIQTLRLAFLLANLFITFLNAIAQNGAVFFGESGEFIPNTAEMPCISPELHEEIRLQNIRNAEELGLRPEKTERGPNLVSFNWPLKQASGYTDPSYYIISNFVDHNSGGGLLDYDCGTRTYNGHNGTDIVIWPFMWYKQSIGQVEIIAAQAGTIINKSDGNFDQNCSCTGTWNAVYVQHSDGSVAWYGHMKNGSLTSKAIGQPVAQGEFLGLVGSSGCSTAPHLHFEVYSNPTQTALIDPFGGACNALNGTTSWWTSQHPYLDPTLLKIMTHSCSNLSQPDGCPANTYTMCAQNAFTAGATATFSNHYRQQQSGHVTTLRIRKPDNSIWQTWSLNNNTTFTYGSWWYWNWTLPSTGPNGTWTFETVYQSQTVTHNFTVSGALPVELTRFTAADQGAANKLDWATKSEANHSHFMVQKSSDGLVFDDAMRIPGGPTTKNEKQYAWVDYAPFPVTYYRLQSVDFDGAKNLSQVVSVSKKLGGVLNASYAQGRLQIHGCAKLSEITLSIFDATGRLLWAGSSEADEDGKAGFGYVSPGDGIYFVKIQSGGVCKTVKMAIVER